ncbi:hypothetical protein [Fluviicola taffensis]|uniref:Uncharacterized protein n=1 Tax=Fluviicola taffensis (strain DSM 16823 / NCIMB 13979 / RW262) TaxID=755732 RepID=F2IBL4_FLUTR|nr:hypothetical protein [Fluviicola taffensis]AEA45340.1 hypothetical protein Fluta_3368 [Fluviicola taffensis DSM 16823]
MSQSLDHIKKIYVEQLGFDLSDSKHSDHPFFNSYNELLALDPLSEEFNYLLYNSLFGPIDYLYELNLIDNSAFELWKNRLIKNTKNVSFYGDLFELYFHWTLVQKNITFKNREKPDFSIDYNGEIFVECTSALFSFTAIPSEKQIFQKIRNSVREKLVVNYMNSSTVLFVDITNPIFHAKKLDLEISKQYLFSILENINEGFKKNSPKNLKSLGAIVFISFDYYEDKDGEWKYPCNIAHYSPTKIADSNLISFLESNFILAESKLETVNPKFHH